MSFAEIEHQRTFGAVVRDEEAGAAIDAETGRPIGFVEQVAGADKVSDFFHRDWQKRRRIFLEEGSEKKRVSWILADDIDSLISSVDIPLTNFNMADGEEPLSSALYAPHGVVDLDKVANLHSDGATIILRAAQRWSNKLRYLCGCLEQDFGFPAQANVYLTPAGKKSTPPHWDNHDLFIVQVLGAKKWRLFSSENALPLDWQRFDPDVYSVGDLVEELEIHEGDVLYLPRGNIHEPVADTYSIHVSLGVLVSRWMDVLIELVKRVAEDEIALREVPDLPRGLFDERSSEALASKLMALIDKLKSVEFCKSAVKGHIISLVAQHGGGPNAGILKSVRATRVTRSTSLQRRSCAYFSVQSSLGKIQLSWRKGSISVPESWGSFIDLIMSGDKFRPDHDAPTPNLTEKVAFCQLMYEHGLLEADLDSGESGDLSAGREIGLGAHYGNGGTDF